MLSAVTKPDSQTNENNVAMQLIILQELTSVTRIADVMFLCATPSAEYSDNVMPLVFDVYDMPVAMNYAPPTCRATLIRRVLARAEWCEYNAHGV